MNSCRLLSPDANSVSQESAVGDLYSPSRTFISTPMKVSSLPLHRGSKESTLTDILMEI